MREVLRHPLRSDVLEHADGRHDVERLTVQLAVVPEPDLDAIGQPGGVDAVARRGCLLGADRHPDGRRAVVGGRMHHQRAPPAPDVEHPLRRALARPSLRQIRSSFATCASSKPGLRRGEPRARVRHRRTEEQAVEGVPHVVVVADRACVVSLRVPPASRAHLLRWALRRGSEDAGAGALRRAPPAVAASRRRVPPQPPRASAAPRRDRRAGPGRRSRTPVRARARPAPRSASGARRATRSRRCRRTCRRRSPCRPRTRTAPAHRAGRRSRAAAP